MQYLQPSVKRKRHWPFVDFCFNAYPTLLLLLFYVFFLLWIFDFDTFKERGMKHNEEKIRKRKSMYAHEHKYVWYVCVCNSLHIEVYAFHIQFTVLRRVEWKSSLADSKIHLNYMKTCTTRVDYAFANNQCCRFSSSIHEYPM